jgi:hypothetical protein
MLISESLNKRNWSNRGRKKITKKEKIGGSLERPG